jgi:hypothetical protein
MKYISESIGFTPKILKKIFGQNMFLPIKSHKTCKKALKHFPSVTRRRRHRRRREQLFYTPTD